MTESNPAGEPARIPLNTGSLDATEISLLIDALDLDMTFVDADRRIRFYNEKYRIMGRTPDIIGEDVVACHSPSTQARVAQLMSEFETGWRDDAEFLEQVKGRLVHIRYVALRDADGTYRGVLESARYADEEPTC